MYYVNHTANEAKLCLNDFKILCFDNNICFQVCIINVFDQVCGTDSTALFVSTAKRIKPSLNDSTVLVYSALRQQVVVGSLLCDSRQIVR